MIRYFLIVIPLLTACKPNAEPLEKYKIYEKKVISFTTNDESSPLGFWETNVEYQVLTNQGNATKKINNEISHIVNEFKCEENKGEKQFKAEIMYLDESIISIQYTDSWLCAGMPHPDGHIGAITYNLKTGNLIDINNEISSNNQEIFNETIKTGLENALQEKQPDSECPPPKWNHYYITHNDFIFTSTNNEYEYAGCTVELPMHIKEIKEYLKKDSIFSSL